MYKVTTSRKSNKWVALKTAGIFLCLFAAIYMGAQAVMQAVYGQEAVKDGALDVAANISVGLGLGIPANVEVEGDAINNYVSLVKESICPTLEPNKTAVEECYVL